jgi:TetR/AcrR family transcriptional regulator
MTMAKPGERRLQILQILAAMLEAPHAERITTAGLAGRVAVSEAALYRHFASKAQMYEGLIEFIEQTLFGFINRISGEEGDGLRQARGIVQLLLGFAEKNRGMTRVLIGEALVNEDPRLQARVNQLLDRVEASLKQSLRIAISQGTLPTAADAAAAANLLLAWVEGRWQQFVKSGFQRTPLAHCESDWTMLARAIQAIDRAAG